jgi:hypothetical protein
LNIYFHSSGNNRLCYKKYTHVNKKGWAVPSFFVYTQIVSYFFVDFFAAGFAAVFFAVPQAAPFDLQAIVSSFLQDV